MALPGIVSQLQSIGDAVTLRAVGAQVKHTLEDGDTPYRARFAQASALISSARATRSPLPTLGEVIAKQDERVIRHERTVMTSPLVAGAVIQAGRAAADSFVQSLSTVSRLAIERLETQQVEIPWLRQTESTELTLTPLQGPTNGAVGLLRPSWGSRSSQRKMYGKRSGTKHYFVVRSRESL